MLSHIEMISSAQEYVCKLYANAALFHERFEYLKIFSSIEISGANAPTILRQNYITFSNILFYNNKIVTEL